MLKMEAHFFYRELIFEDTTSRSIYCYNNVSSHRIELNSIPPFEQNHASLKRVVPENNNIPIQKRPGHWQIWIQACCP
jgi:hypothetical protein